MTDPEISEAAARIADRWTVDPTGDLPNCPLQHPEVYHCPVCGTHYDFETRRCPNHPDEWLGKRA